MSTTKDRELFMVAHRTNVPLRVVKAWWWSMPRTKRSRAQLRAIVRGDVSLVLRWEEGRNEERKTHETVVGGGARLGNELHHVATLRIVRQALRFLRAPRGERARAA